MQNNKQARNLALTIGIILIVCVVSLIVIINSVFNLLSPAVQTVSNLLSSEVRATTVNYNFQIPETQNQEVNRKNTQPTSKDAETETASEDKKEEKEDNKIDPSKLNYNFAVPQLEEPLAQNTQEASNQTKSKSEKTIPEIDYSDVESGVKEESFIQDAQSINIEGEIDSGVANDAKIAIPKIGVNAPIMQGFNGPELLDKGFWLSPNSYKIKKGELMLLCHRRYFGPNDPRSCWYLNEVGKQDEIIIQNGKETLEYKVVGKNVFPAGDPLIYQTTPDVNYLRIVTCTPLGTDTHRLVILAKLQE